MVSFEWWSKGDEPRWRTAWQWANTVGSVGAPFIWGVALANFLHGVPLDGQGDYAGDFLDLFSAYTVFAGLVVVLLFAFHGATFLTLRTSGDLCERAANAARRLAVPAALGAAAFLAWTVAVAVDRNDKDVFPPVLPAALGALALVLAVVFVFGRRSGWAFVMTALGDRARRGDDLHEPLSARARLEPRVREQPDDLERVVLALRAEGDDHRGADRRADRPALPGVDVPRAPRAGGGGAPTAEGPPAG